MRGYCLFAKIIGLHWGFKNSHRTAPRRQIRAMAIGLLGNRGNTPVTKNRVNQGKSQEKNSDNFL